MTQNVEKALAGLEHAVVVQRRRTAKAHVVVSINETNGRLVAVHEVGLVVALLVGGRDGRGQPDLQRVVGASPQGERRLAVLLG